VTRSRAQPSKFSYDVSIGLELREDSKDLFELQSFVIQAWKFPWDDSLIPMPFLRAMGEI